MNILWIATKVPWPPVDGGRLLLWNSLRALRDRDVEVTLVAPADRSERGDSPREPGELARVCRPELLSLPRIPGRGGLDLLMANLRRKPWTIQRHAKSPLRRRVADLLAAHSFDVVLVEQVQALAQVPVEMSTEMPTEIGALPPVVLRAQNVESELWRALAERPGTPPLLSGWLRRQAELLARHEATAVAGCRATLALTREDAEGLRRLGGGDEARIEVVSAPIEQDLVPGQALEGDPAVVVFGSSGWKPNAEGARHFLESAWPEVKRRNPGAVLHLFGGRELARDSGDERLRTPPAPEDSSVALARGSVLVVPLHVASGVRMKILEAWSRGVVVVATPTAARGLEAQAGEDLLVAESPEDLARAVADAVSRYDELVAAARRRLRTDYSFDVFADRLLGVFGSLGIP